LQAYVDEADAILDQAGLDPSDAKPLRKEEVVDLCRERLAGLSPEDLNLIAFAEGFPHPTLVGMSDPSAESPLVFWLNPAYDKHLPQKTKIAAKADERY